MFNDIWGGGGKPLIEKQFVKKRKCNQYNFCKCHQNPLRQLLKQFSKLYQHGGPVTWPFLEEWYKGGFWYFIINSFSVARSYRFLRINIKSLIVSAQVTMEMRFKVLILAVFWRFWTFFELSVLAQAFNLGHWFIFPKTSSIYLNLRTVTGFS